MTFKKQVIGLGLALLLAPAVGLAADEPGVYKYGTITAYDKESRTVTVKGTDWEEKAKLSDAYAKEKAGLLKEGTKVKITFDSRSGGDIRVKVIEPFGK
jgi:hypothetical protein